MICFYNLLIQTILQFKGDFRLIQKVKDIGLRIILRDLNLEESQVYAAFGRRKIVGANAGQAVFLRNVYLCLAPVYGQFPSAAGEIVENDFICPFPRQESGVVKTASFPQERSILVRTQIFSR